MAVAGQGGSDGNDNSEAVQREGVSLSSGYHIERRLLHSAHVDFSDALDESSPTAVPPLPSPAALPVVEAPPFSICDYGWHCAVAERVVSCESKWDADAVSWDGSSYGLFQINAIHFWRWPNAWNEWDNPEVNTRWAWELYQESGWGIWSCR